jgi:hypothetical protein
MNKKGLEMETGTLIEIIIFALLFFIALGIGKELLGYFTGEPDTGTTKSLQTMRIEIGTLGLDESRTIPLFIDKSHVIKGFFLENKGKPTDCKPTLVGEKDKACLCICVKETCDQLKKEINVCEKIDFDLKEEYVLGTKLNEKKDAVPQNCIIKREKQGDSSKMAISCS